LLRIVKGEEELSQDYTPSHSKTPSAEAPPVFLGRRVMHNTFGVGWIIGSEGYGADLKLTVLFARGEKRKLIARYASLQYLD
jgi:hypothetical protein